MMAGGKCIEVAADCRNGALPVFISRTSYSYSLLQERTERVVTQMCTYLQSGYRVAPTLFGESPSSFSLSRSMRNAKKYRVTPTPLLAVYFHRAAMDETQLIDSPSARAASMARCIPARHRWCISGTPLLRGAADLQGLLLFLGIEPYASSAQVLEQCLIRPAEAGDISARTALLALVHTIMWRSVKAQLVERNELKLLPPITEVIPLQLSPMEQGF